MEIVGPEFVYGGGEVYVFDLDGTLIIPIAPEYRHSEDVSKYILRSGVREKIQNSHVVIFTNQLRTKPHVIEGKLNIIRSIAQVTAYIFTSDDKWRKPSPCALIEFINKYNINHNDIIYVGDAAGRRGDFSDSDRKFAMNARVGFMTPEVYFDGVCILSEQEKYTLRGFDPTLVKTDNVTIQPISDELFANELIIFVGPPSSGKSTLTKRLYPSYIKVNQDTVNCGGLKKGTKQQCLRMTEAAMCNKYGICIDNTNPTGATRAEYIAIARKYGYTVKCVLLNIDRELAIHLGSCRKILGGRVIPTVAYNKYFTDFEYPDKAEGFTLSIYGFMPNFDKKTLEVFNYRY